MNIVNHKIMASRLCAIFETYLNRLVLVIEMIIDILFTEKSLLPVTRKH